MNSIRRWVVRLTIFILLMVAILLGTSYILIMPYARDTCCMYGFRLEPEDSLDVVLVGSSSLYTSFYSPLAYEKQGFTSYTLGVSGMTGAMYETAVEEALAHQHPDLFVVDIYGFTYKEQITEVSLHKLLDSIPLNSAVRMNAIDTLVPEDTKNSFLVPFTYYHTNYESIGPCFKVLEDKIRIRLRGYSISKNFASKTKYKSYSGEEDYNFPEAGMQVAEEFLAFCQEKGLKNVLFIRGPVPIEYNIDPSYYELLDKIEAAGYDFLNINDHQEDMNIDQEQDWADKGHLNIFGAVKYTDFLAAYIMDNYDINTSHSEEVTNEWDTCASFNETVINNLKGYCMDKEDIYRYTQRSLLF